MHIYQVSTVSSVYAHIPGEHGVQCAMEEGRRGGLTRLRRLLPRHAGVLVHCMCTACALHVHCIIIINNNNYYYNTHSPNFCTHPITRSKATTTAMPTLHLLHCTYKPRACPGAPLAAAAVVRQRLPLRLSLRASAQPGGQGPPIGDRTAACHECHRAANCRRVQSAECCAQRAYAPLPGAAGGSGRLKSPRVALPEG